MIYKVSFVIVGRPRLGTIINSDSPPNVGNRLRLDGELVEITEIVDLAPPRGELVYLHATCVPVEETEDS